MREERIGKTNKTASSLTLLFNPCYSFSSSTMNSKGSGAAASSSGPEGVGRAMAMSTNDSSSSLLLSVTIKMPKRRGPWRGNKKYEENGCAA